MCRQTESMSLLKCRICREHVFCIFVVLVAVMHAADRCRWTRRGQANAVLAILLWREGQRAYAAPRNAAAMEWPQSCRLQPARCAVGQKKIHLDAGEVAERLNAPVLKTGKGLSPSWVRIPPSPPLIERPTMAQLLKVLSLGNCWKPPVGAFPQVPNFPTTSN